VRGERCLNRFGRSRRRAASEAEAMKSRGRFGCRIQTQTTHTHKQIHKVSAHSGLVTVGLSHCWLVTRGEVGFAYMWKETKQTGVGRVGWYPPPPLFYCLALADQLKKNTQQTTTTASKQQKRCCLLAWGSLVCACLQMVCEDTKQTHTHTHKQTNKTHTHTNKRNAAGRHCAREITKWEICVCWWSLGRKKREGPLPFRGWNQVWRETCCPFPAAGKSLPDGGALSSFATATRFQLLARLGKANPNTVTWFFSPPTKLS
jgi:hypothetical protein